ncbi:MAG: PHP domain-containing protein [Pseudohongiellaceae bacterium]
MRPDLHCHSLFSDGSHEPEFVVDRAVANGITHLALTDHDCINGLTRAFSHARGSDLAVIPGVEISSCWERQEIHIVGLLIDPFDTGLTGLLDQQQGKRRSRIERIAGLMSGRGVEGLSDYMASLGSVAPGRSHVADFLVKRGLCTRRSSAFRLLGMHGPYYSEAQWCGMEQAVAAIQASGGLAVLAHPAAYRLGKQKLRRLVSDFCDAGGDAMEVCYGNCDAATVNTLAQLCLEAKLWASAGSDFHNAAATWTDIGKFPRLPAMCEEKAIWLNPGFVSSEH